jgi:hypothetical protein
MQWTQIFKIKFQGQSSNNQWKKRRMAASKNDIINIEEQDHSAMRRVLNKQRGISKRGLKPQAGQKTGEPLIPGTRSLFKTIQRLPQPAVAPQEQHAALLRD